MTHREIIYRNPQELVPYEHNSRTHTEDQIDKIRASIREYGFTNPILLKDDGATIGAGHARYRAAIAEGLPEVPTITLDGLSEAQWRAYVIADNQLAITGSGWDDALLQAEIDTLKTMDFDLTLTGFSDDDLNALIAKATPGQTPKPKPPGLADEFMIAPFSVLNAREGWWQERKRQWIALGIESEVGRGENLLRFSDTINEPDPEKRKRKTDTRATKTQDWVAGKIAEGDISGGMAGRQSGTSIFDPVLCELAYRWFSPVGGAVLDPFAGGSVRGIVAAALARRYTGIDLRPEQIEANRAQWINVSSRFNAPEPKTRLKEVPALRIADIDQIRVVQDADVLGGTKRRALDLIVPEVDANELVFTQRLPMALPRSPLRARVGPQVKRPRSLLRPDHNATLALRSRPI